MKNKNLIALSGKKQSGKNTVASIIQSLIAKNYGIYKNQLDFINGGDWAKQQLSGYEQKSFAGKLKQIVGLLTGVPVEDLEKEEVKNSTLTEEWWYYTNSLSSLLEDKKLVPYLIATDYIKNSTKWYIVKPTYREILQQLGTDLLRDQLHPDVHINALFADYQSEYTMDSENWNKPISKWIITDCRFPNELETVKKFNGITIKIEKPCEECGIVGGHKMIPHKNKNSTDLHSSETALDDAEFDYWISNHLGIKELIEAVEQILIKEKII